MKLNLDCMRDVLLTLETEPFNTVHNRDTIQKALNEYNKYEIWYALLKLHEAGFITAQTKESEFSYLPDIELITDITYTGHEFLNTIRENKIWKKTKSTAKKIGALSVHTVFEIGKAILESYIQEQILS